ncbi:MAG: hypothetical protein AB8G95_02890 [Anaerolineae bacterium]
MPLFFALPVLVVVAGYAAWEMFRVARFWQDSDKGFVRLLALYFKILAVVMCLLVLFVGGVLLANQP